MTQDSIINILKTSGFMETAPNKYNKILPEPYSVDAYINGHGVIFHLLKENTQNKMTIQADRFEDAAEAFSQLMEYLKSHISLLNIGLSITQNNSL